jgi:hypothetical protein
MLRRYLQSDLKLFLMTENLRRRIHEKKLLVVEAMDICFWISDGGAFYKFDDAE